MSWHTRFSHFLCLSGPVPKKAPPLTCRHPRCYRGPVTLPGTEPGPCVGRYNTQITGRNTPVHFVTGQLFWWCESVTPGESFGRYNTQITGRQHTRSLRHWSAVQLGHWHCQYSVTGRSLVSCSARSLALSVLGHWSVTGQLFWWYESVTPGESFGRLHSVGIEPGGGGGGLSIVMPGGLGCDAGGCRQVGCQGRRCTLCIRGRVGSVRRKCCFKTWLLLFDIEIVHPSCI